MSITRYNHDPCTSFDGRMMPHPNGRYVLHYDHAMDKADAAQDYANLASATNDLLRIAQARAEKAEAALATANDGLYVAIKQSKGTAQ